MRILLDESLPRPFATSLVGHQVKTVGQCGWAGVKNGTLLASFQKLVPKLTVTLSMLTPCTLLELML